jgi:hypothetical protein
MILFPGSIITITITFAFLIKFIGLGRLPRLVDQRGLRITLLLKELLLFLILGSYLGVMFKNASSLITALYVLAIYAFAILVASDASLETLAVLFKAFAFLTIAAF